MGGPLVRAAEDRPAAAASTTSSTVSVTTNPVGAALYVDGKFVGRTPATVASLSPGDHRIRVVKEGFLENARVVSLPAGRTHTLEVTMTPASATAAGGAAQVTSSSSGSKKKWLWIGLAAGGAAAVAYAVLGGKDEAPTAGTVSVSPGTGLQSSTTITVAAQCASDPEGKTLTYTWDFGDGSAGSGQTATRVYTTAGTFSPTVTVSDGKNSATANGSVTIRSMTGTWTGNALVGTSSVPFRFTMTQSGTSVSGTYSDAGGFVNISGTISANNAVTITVNDPTGSFRFSGTVSANVNTWSGSVLDLGTPVTFTATRQ